MTKSLLLTIYRLSKVDELQLAELDACQRELGVSEDELYRLLDLLERQGCLASYRHLPVGSVKLSTYGSLAAEKLVRGER